MNKTSHELFSHTSWCPRSSCTQLIALVRHRECPESRHHVCGSSTRSHLLVLSPRVGLGSIYSQKGSGHGRRSELRTDFRYLSKHMWSLGPSNKGGLIQSCRVQISQWRWLPHPDHFMGPSSPLFSVKSIQQL